MVAFLVATKMLNLPVYLRSGIYYLHTRVNGHQVKRSLHTSNKQEAMIRAGKLLSFIMKFDFDPSNLKKYEIDLPNGVFKATDAEDHNNLMQVLAMLKMSPNNTLGAVYPQTPTTLERVNAPIEKGAKLVDILDKFFALKKQLKPATRLAYHSAISEFCQYTKKHHIGQVLPSDITKYQELLAEKNSARTIDNKIATIRTLYNFAIRMAYFEGKNPAQERALLSTKDKKKGGYSIFNLDEIKRIFDKKLIAPEKENDPDYYWCILLALFTGCRISEITSLDKSQIFSEDGITYMSVLDSKTAAGIREIPLFSGLFSHGFDEFLQSKTGKIFKYKDRLGKGSGNAVSKKFIRQKTDANVIRDKLVFHSLRKFLNNYMNNNSVSLETRCQLMGHEIENVNVQDYTEKIPLKIMAERFFPVLEKLAKEINL